MLKEKEFFRTSQSDIFIKEIGRVIYRMEEGRNCGKMGAYTKEILLTVRNMVSGGIRLLTVDSMRGILKTITFLAKGHSLLAMARFIKEAGLMVRHKATALSNGLMEVVTTGTIKTTLKMAMEGI